MVSRARKCRGGWGRQEDACINLFIQDNIIMENEKKKRGRPPGTRSFTVDFHIWMTPEQKEKLLSLGGAAWVREQIDKEEG